MANKQTASRRLSREGLLLLGKKCQKGAINGVEILAKGYGMAWYMDRDREELHTRSGFVAHSVLWVCGFSPLMGMIILLIESVETRCNSTCPHTNL